MEQEKERKRTRQVLDVIILLYGIGLVIGCLWLLRSQYKIFMMLSILAAILVICMIVTLHDMVFSEHKKENKKQTLALEAYRGHKLQQLVLLDEQGKPIKSWDLQGRTALIIGKAGQDQELDVDLSDCEYSSFIDFQHAVLNFCLDQWYVEDLNSQNGVKVMKVEDGECYRVIHRPCRVTAGDVLYIANTRLLMT